MYSRLFSLLCTLLISSFFSFSSGQVQKAPEKQEGEGPFSQLIIRGVTLINGNGAPPRGPIDIVVENNKIETITRGQPLESQLRGLARSRPATPIW